MPTIEVSTQIHVPRERAVAGVQHGLIGLDQQVTWEARHFGIRQRLTATISAFDRPKHFQDRMLAGAFKSMVHDHDFVENDHGTLMHDRLEFRSPLGPLGWLADRIFLTAYMRRFLVRRNTVIKRIAESNEWRRYLASDAYLDLSRTHRHPNFRA